MVKDGDAYERRLSRERHRKNQEIEAEDLRQLCLELDAEDKQIQTKVNFISSIIRQVEKWCNALQLGGKGTHAAAEVRADDNLPLESDAEKLEFERLGLAADDADKKVLKGGRLVRVGEEEDKPATGWLANAKIYLDKYFIRQALFLQGETMEDGSFEWTEPPPVTEVASPLQHHLAGVRPAGQLEQGAGRALSTFVASNDDEKVLRT